MQSNGRVFLVNSSGIVFGLGATVDVAGLVATSLNLSNADFLAGRYNFTDMPGAQSVSNAGSLAAQGDGLSGGQIYLIAPDVENTGIITAPNGEILLAAGHSVDLVNSIEPNLRVNITAPAGDATNIGQLIAESGSLGLFGTVVRNSGTASADSATTQGGKIVFKASQRAEISGTVSANSTATPPNLPLSGEASTSSLPDKGGLGRVGGTIQVLGNEVGVTGSLDASGSNGGGTVLVGGDYQGKNPEIPNAQVTYVASTATLSADATDNGDGGKVIVWADDTARVYGSISARGGANGGDGGFVETSGRRYLDVIRAPDLAAPSGKGGAWLLDPEDITISSAADSNITASPLFSPAAAGSSILSDAVLRAALVAGATVTVDTTGGGGGTGNILVDVSSNLAGIDLSAGASTLYLKAHNDITVNSSITAINNPLTMYLIADQESDSIGTVYINKALNSNNGNIDISAGGDITLNVGTGTNIAAGTGTVSLTSATGAIIGDVMGAPLDISAASVTLDAAAGILAGGGAQFYVDAGSLSFNNTGSQYVRIYNNHSGASSFTGSTGGGLGLESFDSANPTSVGNVTAGGDIVMRINNLNINGTVDAGANAVYLAPFTSGSPVSIHGGATFDLSGAEISNISAGKIVVGYDTYGNYASSAQVGTGSAVSIINAANLEVWADTLSTGNTVSNAGGQIMLASDAMTLAGAISAGEVWLKGKSSSQNIDLGGADAGTLGLTDAELDQITANILRIGYFPGSGNINVSAAISPANATTISLESGGGITQGAPGAISATNLAIKAKGNVVLNTATNSVGTLAGSITGTGAESFRFKNGGNLSIDTVDGVAGISIANFPSYTAGSSSGVIALEALGNITQTATGSLAGAAVWASSSTGAVNLTTASNPTGILAGSAYNGFSYKSGNTIALMNIDGHSGITSTMGGNIVLDAPGFANNLATPFTTSGRWLVYASSPATVSKGTLTSNFRQYNTVYGGTIYSPTGNGFIYASAPGVLSVNTTLVSGTASHIYGATPTAQFGYAIGNPTSADNEDLLLIAGTPVFTPVISSTTPAGQYGVSYLSGLSSAAGYTFAPGTGLLYIIDPATLALITASLTGTAGKTYDGTNTAPLAPGNFLLSGFVNGDDAIVTKTNGVYENSNVGSGILVSTTLAATDFSPVGSTNLANYTLPTGASGPIGNITPAPLTVAANPDSKVYDGMAYSGGNGVSYSGLMNGETATVLGGTLAYGGTSQGAVNAGSYLITPSGLTSSNYTIGYVDGTLTITPAALGLMSVSANDASKTYGDILTFTGTEFTPAGLLGGDTISGVTLTSPGAVDTANAGIYAITPSNAVFSVGNAGNYTISYVDGQLTVNPAPLTVTADALSKAAGNPDPLLTYTTAGLRLADTIAATLSGELARLAGETAGVYPVNQGTLSLLSSNYTMNYVPADFSIVAPSTVVNELVNNIVLAPPGVPFEPPASPEPAQTPAADADDEESDEAAAVMQDGTPANETATAAAPLPVCK